MRAKQAVRAAAWAPVIRGLWTPQPLDRRVPEHAPDGPAGRRTIYKTLGPGELV